MKVMVIVKASPSSEAGEMPSPELLKAMGEFNEQLVQAGIMRAGEGLKPSSAGKRVRFDRESRVVTDGPFAETKELIAGFWMWEVDSIEHAVEWVKKSPNPMKDSGEIEIRPVFSAEDFAESDPDGSVMKREEEMRKELARVNPATWFEIYVDDLERAVKFYETVLDTKLTKLDAPMPGLEMMAFPMSMDAPGASGALCRMDGVKAGGCSTMIYFSCQDCGVEASRVEAAGGKLKQPKTSIGEYGFIAVASDTEGNVFGLHTPPS